MKGHHQPSSAKSGVTVITVTNKPESMRNLFRNYKQQTWQPRELIVVLNNDRMKPAVYKAYARQVGVQATILQLSAAKTLGIGLNLGIRHAKHKYIAKLDDDDYYGPEYLAEAVRLADRTGAELVGKREFYMYMQASKELLLARKNHKASVAGATLLFRKRLYPKVRFSGLRAGSDMQFLRDLRRAGGGVRSTSRFHFVAVRRADQSNHTWKVNKRTLRNLNAVLVARTGQYEAIVRGTKAKR